MLSFISAKEAAENWNVSRRRVDMLCSQNRIEGAVMVGNMWIIPANAQKPRDKRISRYEQGKHVELKPFVKWVGGKGQLVSELEKYISKNGKIPSKYVEPMVGGGALFFSVVSKYAFKEFYIGDVNAELMNAYKIVQKDVEQLIDILSEMELSYLPLDNDGRKFYYYRARGRYNSMQLQPSDLVEKAALFIFLNKTCFNGLYRVNKKGQFNVPMGAYKNPTICDGENLRNISRALQNVNIVCGDFTASENFVDNDTFVYVDPPYRPISQTSAFTSYNVDSFDDNEQVRLAEYINRLSAKGARVVLSNSDPKNVDESDNFFDDLYNGYSIKRVSAARAINSKGDCRGKISELIISNI